LSVVTGATDGIGKEYAIQLAAEHRLNIVLISRSIDRLNNVAREIGILTYNLLLAVLIKNNNCFNDNGIRKTDMTRSIAAHWIVD
jgi:short-subunit dehydrogenase